MSCQPFSDVLRSEYDAIFKRWGLQAHEANRPPGPFPDGLPEFSADRDGSEKQEKEAVNELYELMHKAQSGEGTPAPHPLAALCFSGGGIRSATFNLGVLQRLAWHGLLDQFDYLSTVSGGGFIGSWLTAWAHRDGGLGNVVRKLNQNPADPLKNPLPQVKHLRDFSRYLSPRVSLLSADTWTLLAIYVRNLVLNWTVLIPLLLAVLMVPRLSAALIDLFPVLELKTGNDSSNSSSTPITVNLQSNTPGTDLSVVVTPSPAQTPSGSASPAAAPVEAEPVIKGTAPWYLPWVLFVFGILFVGWSYWFALRSEPIIFREDPKKTEPISDSQKAKEDSAATTPCADVPAKPHKTPFQVSFLWLCLAPLVLGACLLSVGWAWAESPTTDNFHNFVLIFGASMPLIAWVALSFSKRWNGRVPQLLAAIFAGLVAGALLWLSAKLLETVHGAAGHIFHGQGAAAADGWETAIYATLAVPLVLGSLAIAAMIRTGLLSRAPKSTDEFREWWSRFGAWVTIAIVAWLVIWALVLLVPGLILYSGSAWARTGWAALGGATGLFTILVGKSSQTPATSESVQPASTSARVNQILLAVAAPIFLCLIIAALSLAMDGLLSCRFGFDCTETGFIRPAPDAQGAAWHFAMIEVFDDDTEYHPQVQRYLYASLAEEPPENLWQGTLWPLLNLNRAPLQELAQYYQWKVSLQSIGQWGGFTLLLIWFVGLAAIGVGMSFLINLNRFSLHETYRNRLVRAYLGASSEHLTPDRFTGFDDSDNLRMAELRAPKAPDGDAEPKQPDGASKPLGSLPVHVINMTLNVASESTELSWQDRQAMSFTISPYFAGSNDLGYRPTCDYGSENDGMSVGTAVAISGAAVSPEMGSHSSAFVSFLLTLFNVRLGAWLGNPGPVGEATFHRSSPRSGALHVVAEAFGLASARHKYVYLTDGGHFENLALYEMVRRRCRYIVVCDAGADPDYGFEDLANAVRKVRIDFGISIVFAPSVSIVALKDPKDPDIAKGKYCAIGRIKYDSTPGNDGFLLYIKPAFYKRNEPVDVRSYAGMSQSFPQEPTADQFFTESQFESYRALGEHIVDEIQGLTPGDNSINPAGTLEEFQRLVKKSVLVEAAKAHDAAPEQT